MTAPPERFAPEWPISTDRLLLRPFEPGDLDALYAVQSDAEMVRYLYFGIRTREEVRDPLAERIAGAALKSEGEWLSAAVILRETGEFVGDVGLHWVSALHRQGELGFVIHPAHHGRGYAVEASIPLLDFAFHTLELHRVVGRAEPRNAPSVRVLQKLGMRPEAHLIESEWVKGEWQSEVVYAILASEWATRSDR